jgi:hypothetical protein
MNTNAQDLAPAKPKQALVAVLFFIAVMAAIFGALMLFVGFGQGSPLLAMAGVSCLLSSPFLFAVADIVECLRDIRYNTTRQ